MNTLLQRAKELYPELKDMKDDLHRHPELSFQEVRTTALLKESSPSWAWSWWTWE